MTIKESAEFLNLNSSAYQSLRDLGYIVSYKFKNEKLTQVIKHPNEIKIIGYDLKPLVPRKHIMEVTRMMDAQNWLNAKMRELYITPEKIESHLQSEGYFIITNKGMMYKERLRDKVYTCLQHNPYSIIKEYKGKYKFERNVTNFEL